MAIVYNSCQSWMVQQVANYFNYDKDEVKQWMNQEPQHSQFKDLMYGKGPEEIWIYQDASVEENLKLRLTSEGEPSADIRSCFFQRNDFGRPIKGKGGEEVVDILFGQLEEQSTDLNNIDGESFSVPARTKAQAVASGNEGQVFLEAKVDQYEMVCPPASSNDSNPNEEIKFTINEDANLMVCPPAQTQAQQEEIPEVQFTINPDANLIVCPPAIVDNPENEYGEVHDAPEEDVKISDCPPVEEPPRDPVYVIDFHLKCHAHAGENVVATGGSDFLGNWNPANGFQLNFQDGVWVGRFESPTPIDHVEYKYVINQGQWEGGANRKLDLSDAAQIGHEFIIDTKDEWRQ